MKENRWTWKEFIVLVSMAMIFVPLVIDWQLASWLDAVMQNDLYKGTLIGLILAILFTGSTYFIALRPHGYSWQAIGVGSVKKSQWKTIVFWTIIYIFVGLLYVIILEVIGFGSANAKTEAAEANLTLFGFMIGFLSAAVISPIYEELFYRGFIYTWLRSRLGIRSSMLISSLIFTLAHIPTYNTLVLNFLDGMVFAWVYEKTGSIVSSMVVHAVLNGITVVLIFLF
ncbi:CPBP family intramembrane glutamic endopeptidase [Jeotgalibacillus marinus]|uniref:CPBP family intramembrane glutamic endopeptidase n=1 Tax=Jeotgalibacillus marinus TaxID=86667 RepID=A0ABV3Q6J3_9BACL